MSGRAGGAATYAIPVSEELPALPSADPEFVIGVIDSGIVAGENGTRPHPYLAGHLSADWPENLDTLGPSVLTDGGHGTFVAGLILQQAPTATIRMSNALAGWPGDTNDQVVVDAITAMADRDEHLSVLNLSFFGEERDEPRGIHDALVYLFQQKPDVMVIAAAGNSWTDAPRWPAAFDFPQLKSIGATDESIVAVRTLGHWPPKASFSNYGRYVHAYASGVDVTGPFFLDPDGSGVQSETGWVKWGGTSFAAAQVTGLLAQKMRLESLTGPQAWAELVASSAGLVGLPGQPQELWGPRICPQDTRVGALQELQP